jgi:hypothetical protein
MTPSIFCLPVDCIFLIGTITESLIISCALIVTHVKKVKKKVNTISIINGSFLFYLLALFLYLS